MSRGKQHEHISTMVKTETELTDVKAAVNLDCLTSEESHDATIEIDYEEIAVKDDIALYIVTNDCIDNTEPASIAENGMVNDDSISEEDYMCEFTTEEKVTWLEHIRTDLHDNSLESNIGTHRNKETTNSTGEKPFQCNRCEYTTTVKGNFKNHMFRHTPDKPFKCSLCDYQTSWKLEQKIHIDNHMSEKPLRCNQCDYQTASENALKIHIKYCRGKPLKCNQCDYQTTSMRYLNLHSKYCHMNEKCFAHGGYEYKTVLKHDLNQQVHRDTGEKPIPCDRCNSKTAFKQSWIKHTSRDKNDKPFACGQCEFKTTLIPMLEKHMEIHTTDKPNKLFACTHCKYKTAFVSNLKRHLKNHLEDKPFSCNLCSYKTTFGHNFKAHMSRHTGEKPFACTLCEFKTAIKRNLQTHIKRHVDKAKTIMFNQDTIVTVTVERKIDFKTDVVHLDSSHIKWEELYAVDTEQEDLDINDVIADSSTTNNDVPDNSFVGRSVMQKTQKASNEIYMCYKHMCKFKTDKKADLVEHVRNHPDDNSLRCDECDYRTAVKANLKRHLSNKHKAEKKFICDQCEYRTALKKNFGFHMMRHSGVQPFACTLCKYKTLYKGNLKVHMSSHRDHKPFACIHCEYTTAIKSSLKKHMFCHTGEKPFACNQCPYKTGIKQSFKLHMKRHADRENTLESIIICAEYEENKLEKMWDMIDVQEINTNDPYRQQIHLSTMAKTETELDEVTEAAVR